MTIYRVQIKQDNVQTFLFDEQTGEMRAEPSDWPDEDDVSLVMIERADKQPIEAYEYGLVRLELMRQGILPLKK